MQEFLIGICDDEEKEQETILRYCRQCLQELGQSASFALFSSGEELLSYEGERIHLLFLDVEMNGMDGLQVVRELEQSDMVWRVVFVTSHQEAVFDSFGIRTLGFECKPIYYDKVKKWLGVTYREFQKKTKIVCETLEGMSSVLLEQLVFVEAQRNYVRFWLGKDSIFVNGNLKEWEEKLKNLDFVRVHKTYLVNMMHVQKLGKCVELKGGGELPIGRAYKTHATEQYHRFICKIVEGRM